MLLLLVRAKGYRTLIVASFRISCSAKKEIIVSAGAFQSPQLLMVSGIGPKAQLSKFNIDPVVINENVGQGMQDHIFFGVRVALRRVAREDTTDPGDCALGLDSLRIRSHRRPGRSRALLPTLSTWPPNSSTLRRTNWAR